ncbi:DUF1758 domain-containing protein [Trichonephila clavipes]|nr:DUF1758 domain-containing protein [Trichonephila clavipes]
MESELRIKLARNTFTSENLSKQNSNRYEGKNSIPTAAELLSSHKHTHSKDQSKNFKRNETCVFYEKSHPSPSCKDTSTTEMSLENKKIIVKNKKACFVCLKGGHRAISCKNNVRCFACQNRHFPILCPDLASNLNRNYPNNTNNTKVEEIVTNTLNNHVRHSDVYLQTLIVKLHNGTKEMLVRAIFDTDSMKSCISSDIVKSMNYKSKNEVNLKQSLFGGIETVESVHINYVIELSNIVGGYRCKFEVLGQEHICSEIEQHPSGPWLNELKIYCIQLTNLEINRFNVDKEIKLLIGADVGGKLLKEKSKLLNLI